MTQGMLKELEQYCKPLTLLFVEDDKMIQESIISSLELFFKTIYVADNGLEALEIYKHNDIDLIISDINMPFMNGIELVKKVKEIKVNQAIIVLTAHKDFDYIHQLLHLGISAYVVKDGGLDDLYYKILIEAEKLAFKKVKKMFKSIIEDNTKREKIITPKIIVYPQTNNIEEFKQSNKEILTKDMMKNIELKLDKQDIEEAYDLNQDLEQIIGSIFMTKISKEQLLQIYDMLVKFHHTFYTFLEAEQRLKLEPFANKVQNIIDFMETIKFDTLTTKQKEALGLFEFIVEELMKFINKVLIDGEVDNMYYIGKTLDDNVEQIRIELGMSENMDQNSSEFTLF